MSLMIRFLIAVSLALIAALAVACGGDDDDDEVDLTSTVNPPTETATVTATQPSGDDDDGDDDDDDGDDDDEPAVINLVLYYPRVTETDFELVGVERTIDDTPQVGAAALNLLIEGPTQDEIDDLDISDPIPEGTELLSLNIEDGVATADFSEELLDFGGGSLNVQTITAMIEETLMQFPTVESVEILVEGEADQLQP